MFWSRISLSGLLLLLVACGGGKERNAEPAPTKAVPVIVFTAAEVYWPNTFEASGTVRARTTTTLSSRSTGYVREVRPREGDRVSAGDIVVKLEAAEIQTAQQQAQAALEEARAGLPEADSALESAQIQLDLSQVTLRRMRELLDKRSVSQHEFDQASAQARMAESAKGIAQARRRQLDQRIQQTQRLLESAETQIGYLEVRAPFSGRVTARRAEPGILASPGVPLLELESDAGYRLEAIVPEAHLRAVRQGQTVEVRIDALGAPFTARVEEIVPEIDSASRSFIGRIALPARSELRTGLFGRALFRTGQRSVLVIPRAAVAEQGQLRSVLVVADGVTRSRMVRVGEERDAQSEILSGLSAGERVVSPRPPGLTDGQRVEAQP